MTRRPPTRVFSTVAVASLVLAMVIAAASAASLVRSRQWPGAMPGETWTWAGGVLTREGGTRGGLHVYFRNVIPSLTILPCVWVWRRLRPPRPEGRFCHRCGYDLRATTDRCPECGTIPA